jgi:hypothetical protein
LGKKIPDNYDGLRLFCIDAAMRNIELPLPPWKRLPTARSCMASDRDPKTELFCQLGRGTPLHPKDVDCDNQGPLDIPKTLVKHEFTMGYCYIAMEKRRICQARCVIFVQVAYGTASSPCPQSGLPEVLPGQDTETCETIQGQLMRLEMHAL